MQAVETRTEDGNSLEVIFPFFRGSCFVLPSKRPKYASEGDPL